MTARHKGGIAKALKGVRNQPLNHPLTIHREGCPSSRDMGAIRKHRKVSLLSRQHPNPIILEDVHVRKA